MAGPLRLEVFEAPALDRAKLPSEQPIGTDAFVEARLAGFEQGYKAGWDDAAAAQDEDQRRLRSDIGRNLQELAFTYYEAKAHLLGGLATVIETICTRVVPEVAQAAIGGLVVEHMMPLAEAAGERPITIVLNPQSRTAVEAALADGHAPPFQIIEEPSLAEGQVQLRFEDSELHLDIDGAVAAIGTAVTAHFNSGSTGEERSYG